MIIEGMGRIEGIHLSPVSRRDKKLERFIRFWTAFHTRRIHRELLIEHDIYALKIDERTKEEFCERLALCVEDMLDFVESNKTRFLFDTIKPISI